MVPLLLVPPVPELPLEPDMPVVVLVVLPLLPLPFMVVLLVPLPFMAVLPPFEDVVPEVPEVPGVDMAPLLEPLGMALAPLPLMLLLAPPALPPPPLDCANARAAVPISIMEANPMTRIVLNMSQSLRLPPEDARGISTQRRPDASGCLRDGPVTEMSPRLAVGAGAAGCVLVNRLPACPRNRVLLLEAGGKDSSPRIHILAGFFRNIYHPKIAWQLQTEPLRGLGGCRAAQGAGRIVVDQRPDLHPRPKAGLRFVAPDGL